MFSLLATFTVCIISWIAFTQTLAVAELATGAIVSLIVALMSRDISFQSHAKSLFDPRVWVRILILAMVFVVEEIKAHLIVSKMILTGKVLPAVVKVKDAPKDPSARTLLANMITLTPGTLTVEADDGFFVHWLGFEAGRPVAEQFSSRVGGVFK